MKPNKGKKTLVNGTVSRMPRTFDSPALGEISFDAVLLFDAEGRITYWNPAAEQMYGWTAEEVLGKTENKLFSTSTPQKMTDHQERHAKMKQGHVVHGEHRPCRKDGSLFHVEYVSRAIFDAQGEASGYMAVHREMTSHLESKKQIEFIARMPIENPNPVMRLLPGGELLFANSASETLLNFWKQGTGQVISNELYKDIKDAFATGSVRTTEVEFEGKTFSFTVMPVREMGYVNLYGNDITERRRISRELVQSHADLQDQMNEMRTLMELLPIGVWIGNHDCSVITGNPAAYQVMGLEPGINASVTHPEPETPPDLRIFVDGQEVLPENAPMQAVARTGTPLHNIEHELLFQDGTRKTVLANIVPLFDEQGKVRKVIGAYADLTERKQGAKRLAHLQQMTAALLEAVTPEQVASIVIQQGVSALSGTGGTIFSLTEDGSGLEILYSSMPGSVTRPYQNLPLELDMPVTHALRSATPIWIKSQQEYKERYPHLVEQIETRGLQAAAAIPLIMKDRRLGVFTLSFDHVHEFATEERDFILTMAQQAAQAMERTKLHRKMTRALSELQLTYDQTPIGMIQMDDSLRYRRVNEAIARMNGISAADHIGKTMQDIVPDLSPKLEDGLRRVMETGEPEFDIEIIGETQADPGVPHTWLESWYPWRNENGKVAGVNITIQDITKRKRDELALAEYARQQAALYELADKLHRTQSMQDIFDAALEAILRALSCDRASILLFDDAGVMRFVAWRGLSVAYRLSTDGHSPWRPDDKNASLISYHDIRTADLSESLKAIIQKEGIGSLAFIPLVFEEKLIGKFMVYFDTPHSFSENDLELSQTIAHQIAFGVQRTRAQDALRESEERFTQFMQHLPGLAWIKDMQGRYVYANHAAQQVFNTAQEQLYGRRDEDIFPPEVAAQFRKNDELALTEGKGIQVVETLEQADGIHFSLASKFPIPGPDDTIVLIGGTAFDITDRKRAEEALLESQMELQILNDTLEQKVQAQTAEIRKLASDLTKAEQRERNRVARILHDDLQQRLYAIQIQIASLSDIHTNGEQGQRNLAAIKKQLQEAVLLTRRLSIDLSPPILHDEGLTQAVEWLASQMKKQHGLQVDLQADESFTNPDIDLRVLVFNCIRELLFNIVKHAGGNQAHISLQRSNSDLYIVVRDEGKGFNVAELPWQNLDIPDEEEDGRDPQSFGLATIYHQLGLFGGQMDIQSEPGKGTVVTITIPYP